MKLCKDPVVLGYLAGLLATVVKNVLGLFCLSFGLVKKLICISLIGRALMVVFNTPAGYLLGILTDFVTGGAIGMVIALVYRRTGKSCWLAKGFIAGTLSWLLGVVIVFNLLLAGESFPGRGIGFWLVTLADHAVYGIVTVYLARRWYFQGK